MLRQPLVPALGAPFGDEDVKSGVTDDYEVGLAWTLMPNNNEAEKIIHNIMDHNQTYVYRTCLRYCIHFIFVEDLFESNFSTS